MLAYKTKYILQDFHHDSVACLALSPDGALLASGGIDGLVFIWSFDSGQLLYDIKLSRAILCSAWLRRDPDCLVLGCENGLLTTVVITKDEIRTSQLEAHHRHIECLSLARGLVRLVTGAHDEVIVWHQHSLQNHERVDWTAELVIPEPPSRRDNEKKELIVVSLHWHQEPRDDVHDRHSGLLIASYPWHGIICWDLTSLAVAWQIGVPNCLASAISPDRRLLATYMLPHTVQIHDIFSQTKVKTMHSPSERGYMQLRVAFAHDGLALVGASTAGRVRLWDVSSGDRLQVLPHKDNQPVRCVITHYDPASDTFYIITGTTEGHKSKVCIWHTNNPQDDSKKQKKLVNQFQVYIAGQELFMLAFLVLSSLIAFLAFYLLLQSKVG